MSVATLDAPVLKAVRQPISTGINAVTLFGEIQRLENLQNFADRHALFTAVIHGDWNQGLLEDVRFKTVDEVKEKFNKYQLSGMVVTPAQRGRVAGEYDPKPLQDKIAELESATKFPSKSALYNAVAEAMDISVATVQSRIREFNLIVTTESGKKGREKTMRFTAEQAQAIIDVTPENQREWLMNILLPVTSE